MKSSDFKRTYFERIFVCLFCIV